MLAVASNGSVTFSYPPVEVLDTVTFDACEVVRLLLEHVPTRWSRWRRSASATA